MSKITFYTMGRGNVHTEMGTFRGRKKLVKQGTFYRIRKKAAQMHTNEEWCSFGP